MKKKFAVVAGAVFLAVLMLPTIAWQALTLTERWNPHWMEQMDYDLGEKREKAPFPEKFDMSSYTAELEAYYNDRVPFRSLVISVNRRLDTCLEGVYRDRIRPALLAALYPEEQEEGASTLVTDERLERLLHRDPETSLPGGTCAAAEDSEHRYELAATVEADYDTYGYDLLRCTFCHREERVNVTEKPIDTSYFPPNIMNELVLEGRRKWLYYAGDNSVEYYRGTNLLSEETLEDYSGRVKELQEICDAKGIRLQLMIVPDKDQVYPEYMPSYTLETDKKRVRRLVDSVREKTGIEILFPEDVLKAAKPYLQTYYRYDTHWNYAGAFIAEQLLNQSLGLPVTYLDEFQYETAPGGGGDLCPLAGLDSDNYIGDTFYYPDYKPEITILSESGDVDEIITTVSDSPNQCKAVFIGDSFRIGLVPYLQKDYSRMVIAHRDFLGQEELQKEIRDADVLIVTAVERFDERFMDSIRVISAILNESQGD